jgi:hypothetical protein
MRLPNPLDAFSPGVNLFQRHLNLCLSAGVVCFIVNGAVQVPGIVLDIAQGGNSPGIDKTLEIAANGAGDDQLWLLLTYVTIFLQGCTGGVLALGLSRIGLKLLDGQDADLEDIIPSFSELPGAFVAATTVAVLSTLGLFLCCVPGIFLFGLFMYWPTIMVDQRVGSLTALTRSASIAMKTPKEHGFAGALLLVMWLAGYQCCGLPVVFLAPMSAMIVARSYRNHVPKLPVADPI